MQANCPKCSNRLNIDDAKIPAGQFVVKCPQCQTALKLQGRPPTAASPAPAPPASAPSAPSPPSPPSAPPAASTPPPAAARPPLPPAEPGSAGRALIAFADERLTAAADSLLTRLGYNVDPISDPDAAVRLDQGDYNFVSTTVNGFPEAQNVYVKLLRSPPERRRRTFLMLIGEEFRTDEGSQAWIRQADLVVHPNDLVASDRLIDTRTAEKERLYQTYLDVEDRKERGEI